MRCKQPRPHVTETLVFPRNVSLPNSTTVYKTVELRLREEFVDIVQLTPCYSASLAHTESAHVVVRVVDHYLWTT